MAGEEHPLRERALDRINFKVAESIMDIGENKMYYYANDCEMQVALGSVLRNKLQMIVFRFNAARWIAESPVRITWVVSSGECNKRWNCRVFVSLEKKLEYQEYCCSWVKWKMHGYCFSSTLYFLHYLINYYGEFRSFFKLKTVPYT